MKIEPFHADGVLSDMFLRWIAVLRLKLAKVPDEFEGWRDITADIDVQGTGASDPTWSVMGAGPLKAYKFAVNDECWMRFHIPHDIVRDTDIHFHAHWTPDGTNVQPVKWQWQFAYARGFNQDAFPIKDKLLVPFVGVRAAPR